CTCRPGVGYKTSADWRWPPRTSESGPLRTAAGPRSPSPCRPPAPGPRRSCGSPHLDRPSVRRNLDIAEPNTPLGEQEAPQLVRVRHAARLEHLEDPVALAVRLDLAHQEPGVHQRRDADLGLLEILAAAGKAGEQRGDLKRLEEIDQPHQHRAHLSGGT